MKEIVVYMYQGDFNKLIRIASRKATEQFLTTLNYVIEMLVQEKYLVGSCKKPAE